MKRHLTEALSVGIGATALSYLVALLLGWVQTVNYIEVFAVFASYVCTWLCVRERRINYPIGATATFAYAILFWQNDLMASALLNAYLTPALIYGWFRWREDAKTRPVGFVGLRWWPVYVIVTAATYGGAVWLVSALGGTFATTDAIILIGTILAQFLLDNKKLETWGVWAVVNVAAIYTYFHAGLPLAGFQYVLFLANTIVGFIVWKRNYDKGIRLTDSIAADHGTLAAGPVR